MKFSTPFFSEDPLRKAIQDLYLSDESLCAEALLDSLNISSAANKRIEKTATDIVQEIRHQNENHGGLDAFLQEFKLSSEEGVALMCLAEALLRVPDAQTADKLIQDKLVNGDWQSHLGESESFFVNASTWGLMLTGKVMSLNKGVVDDAGDYFGKLIARSGEPLIRAAVKQAMKIMGKQFVLAETIEKALIVSQQKEDEGYTYSYDMLGEAARTEADALGYFSAYEYAIDQIGGHSNKENPGDNPGISVKLSALHPRYEFLKETRVIQELYPRLLELCQQAKSYNIGLTIDAEESERLEPSLTMLEMLCNEHSLKQWSGLGFVVQSYQKRAPAVLDWIAHVCEANGRKIMIRLVKGAYWDTEIKKAQVEGHSNYPVFTRKITTDVSYLVCAEKLLGNPEYFYPLFATHNAHTVSSILEFAGDRRDFEFQCLHGMGEILYNHVINEYNVNCRIYAPVGSHKDLLAYLVRRLLENGANSSFVNRLVDKELPIEKIIRNPAKILEDIEPKFHPNIPLPLNIFPDRENSQGLNLNHSLELNNYFTAGQEFASSKWHAVPLLGTRESVSGKTQDDISKSAQQCFSPNDGKPVGSVITATEAQVEQAINTANDHADSWNSLGGKQRAELLRRCADAYQNNRDELLSLCIMEAGKTTLDAVAELREAIDFLRYYANQAESQFEGQHTLIGPTGELNQWSLHGRGVFVCISPWNFPLAIFTGQIAAALAAGNSVLAKPAEQTPLIAHCAVKLMHQCGIAKEVIQLLPGDGALVGAKLIESENIHGVTFTGSTETANIIQQTLARKPGPIIPLIAETGGMNAMIVDSTALPEQVIRDAIQSAFQSAGQRCSALRVLYLQEDIADQMIEMLIGAMQELKIGNPMEADTDIGPIIDQEARQMLEQHVKDNLSQNKTIYRSPETMDQENGYYFSPALIEIDSIKELSKEVFGPILHVCRFSAENIDSVVDDINLAGYGLTFGIHSRIESTINRITKRIKVGNVYVNRNTIGAVVGVQPFGGEGLSGTGPKAGGPHYLHRFAVERSISTDTTAAGGNTSLLSLEFL